MANLNILISDQLTDLDGADTRQQVFATVADTLTLAQLVTACQAYQVLLDGVTDPLLTETQVSIVVPLTGGLKSVAGPNPIIKGALFNGLLTGFSNRSYGMTTPGWAQSKIAGGKVDVSDAAVILYYTLWNATPIVALGALRSNHWEALQPFRRVKLNDRSVEREYNSISEENIP